MEAPDQVQKKRPPYIKIPPLYPQPIIPGPNAFAIAERAAQAKQDMQREIEEVERLQFQPTSGDGEQKAPTNEGEMSPGLRSKEAFSNLCEGIRRTPKKGKQPSWSSSSQYSAASGPQYTEHGSLSAPSTQKPLGGFGAVPTARAEIEARREPKYLKMMGQLPEAPSTDTALYSDGNIQVNDYRPGNSFRSSKNSGSQELASKSPKKKIFGMNIPFTSRSAPKLPTPPMKFKASKFLGVTPPAKSKKLQMLASIKSSATAPRSETSKSLPTKLFSQNDPHASRRSPPHGARRSPKGDKSPPLSRARRRSPPIYPPVFSHPKTLRDLTGAEEPEVPPLPPRKDSLPFVAAKKSGSVKKSDSVKKSVTLVSPEKESASPKKKKAWKDYFDPHILKLLTPPVPDHKLEDFTDKGMKVRPPSVFSLDSSPRGDDDELSDLQETVFTAKASLVEGPSIDSSRVTVEHLSSEDELSSDSTLLRMLYPISPPPGIHRSASLGSPDDWRTSELAAPELEFLKPTVYVPPQAAVRKPVDPAPLLNQTVFTRPKVAIRDLVNPPLELKPTSNVPSKATARDPVKPGSQLKSTAGYMHPGSTVNETFIRTSEQIDQLKRYNTPGSDKPAPQPVFGFIPITFRGELDDIDPQSKEVQEFRRTHNISPRVKHLQRIQQDQARVQYQTYQERVGDADHIARVMAGFRFLPPVPASAPVQDPHSRIQTPGPASAPVQNPGSGSLRTGQSSARFNPTGLQRSSTVSTPSRNMGMQGTLTGQPYPGPSSQWMPRHAHEGEASVSAHIQKVHEHVDLVAVSTLDQMTKMQDESTRLLSAKHEEMKATVDEQIKDIKSLVTSFGEQMLSRNTQVNHIQQSLDELGSYIKSDVIKSMQDQTERMEDLEQRVHGMELSVAALQVSSRRMLAERHVSPRRPPRPEHAPIVPESRSRPILPSLYDRSDPFQSTVLSVPSNPPDSGLSRGQLNTGPLADNRESRSSYHGPGSGAGAPQQSLRPYPPMYDPTNPFGRHSESQE